MGYTKKFLNYFMLILSTLLLFFLLSGCQMEPKEVTESEIGYDFSWEECNAYLFDDDYIKKVQELVQFEDQNIYQALPYDKGFLFLSYPLYSEGHTELWNLYYVEQGNEPVLLDQSMASEKRMLPRLSSSGEFPIYLHESLDEGSEPGYTVKCLDNATVVSLQDKRGETQVEPIVESYGPWYAYVVQKNEEKVITVGNVKGDGKTFVIENDKRLVTYELTEDMLFYVIEKPGNAQYLYAKNLKTGESYNEEVTSGLTELCSTGEQGVVGCSKDEVFYINWDGIDKKFSIELIPSNLKDIKRLSKDDETNRVILESSLGVFLLNIELKRL